MRTAHVAASTRGRGRDGGRGRLNSRGIDVAGSGNGFGGDRGFDNDRGKHGNVSDGAVSAAVSPRNDRNSRFTSGGVNSYQPGWRHGLLDSRTHPDRRAALYRSHGGTAKAFLRGLGRSKSPDRDRPGNNNGGVRSSRGERRARRSKRRRDRDRTVVSPSQQLPSKVVDDLVLHALSIVLKYRRPPFNISVISDCMADITREWSIQRTEFSTFSQLCRALEDRGWLQLGRKGESIVLMGSSLFPYGSTHNGIGPDRTGDHAGRRRREEEIRAVKADYERGELQTPASLRNILTEGDETGRRRKERRRSNNGDNGMSTRANARGDVSADDTLEGTKQRAFAKRDTVYDSHKHERTTEGVANSEDVKADTTPKRDIVVAKIGHSIKIADGESMNIENDDPKNKQKQHDADYENPGGDKEVNASLGTSRKDKDGLGMTKGLKNVTTSSDKIGADRTSFASESAEAGATTKAVHDVPMETGKAPQNKMNRSRKEFGKQSDGMGVDDDGSKEKHDGSGGFDRNDSEGKYGWLEKSALTAHITAQDPDDE